MTYPFMPYSEYTSLVSTYIPPQLGEREIEILYLFGIENSSSVYDLFKAFERYWRGRSGQAYKDIHKRVKRLAQLKLIYEIKEHFERGAKHYRITPYGLITCIDNYTYWNFDSRLIFNQKKNIVILSLLLEFLEEETIDSFRSSSDRFPTMEIGEYLHDCCSITVDICKKFWTDFEKYNITDILPNDDIIQKYMSYLDGKPVDQYILDEIKEYDKRLMAKIDNNAEPYTEELSRAVHRYYNRDFSVYAIQDYGRSKSFKPYNRNYLQERPPFPLLDIYHDVVWMLNTRLKEKTKLLAFNIASQLGEMITNSRIENQNQLEDFLKKDTNYSLRHILKDKQFNELVRAVKEKFDTGYKQFLYYH
jgi:hypothetical protein